LVIRGFTVAGPNGNISHWAAAFVLLQAGPQPTYGQIAPYV